jgi:endonuclease/exonuclease/phosphatase (EEP) superfamily protein YafD
VKKIKKTIFSIALISIVIFLFSQFIVEVPKRPQQIVLGKSGEQSQPACYEIKQDQPIDNNGELVVLVWNIYKQSKARWEPELDRWSEGAQLVLLQEASITEAFKGWVSKNRWESNHVNAFSVFDTSSGVINLTKHPAKKACVYTAMEPWLRLPKSGIYALYPLSNGTSLAVVNVHAINFTVGTAEYQQQLNVLKQALTEHTGPILLAGDFNTWSKERSDKLNRDANELDLTQVKFSPDDRTQFINGLPLDHIYYKDLRLIKAKAPMTDASDHSPLIAEFRLVE